MAPPSSHEKEWLTKPHAIACDDRPSYPVFGCLTSIKNYPDQFGLVDGGSQTSDPQPTDDAGTVVRQVASRGG